MLKTKKGETFFIQTILDYPGLNTKSLSNTNEKENKMDVPDKVEETLVETEVRKTDGELETTF